MRETPSPTLGLPTLPTRAPTPGVIRVSPDPGIFRRLSAWGAAALCAAALLGSGALPASAAEALSEAAEVERVAGPPPDAVSAATEVIPLPNAAKLRVAIVAYVRPSPFEAIVEPTVEALRRQFGEDMLDIRRYTLPQLADAIRAHEVDVFLSSSGFFLRMVPDGARSLATVVSEDYPDPNHNDGSTLVVLDKRRDLVTLSDLKGKRLATSSALGFTGKLVPMGEIFRAGYDPETFFSETYHLGGGTKVHEALDMLRSGAVDVVNLRLCFMEEWLSGHPEDAGYFRVVNRKDGPVSTKPEACARSTDLYPSWTIATTSATDPNVSRLVTRVLLQMRPQGEKKLYWGVATDFSSIDQLYRDLKTGPYAYLREWTVRRFVSEHREWFILAALLALGLVGHSVRVSQLVRRRTRDLVTALDTQKQLEDKARAAGERLQRLERIGVVGQLSTIFAHEMRQPLGAISLYSFALRKMAQAAGKTDGTQSPGTVPAASILDVLEKLDRQTARADAIVTKVRSYAKRQGASRSVVALKDLVGSAVTDLRITGRWKSVIETMPMEEVDIDADPLEMELVAVNLTKNALESLDAQVRDGTFPASTSYVSPTVIVSVTRETVEGEPHAVLTVTDNGRAVGDDLLTSLADMAPSSKSEGLGLGLSIVRGIVENHAGRLTFGRSAWGSLSVRVTLPVAKPKTAAPEPSESEASSETPSTPAAPGGL